VAAASCQLDNDEEENPALALDDSAAKSRDARAGADDSANEVAEMAAQPLLADAGAPHSLPAVDDAVAADSFGEAADGGSQSVSAEASASDDGLHSSGNKDWA
jgi:hypothetical protein